MNSTIPANCNRFYETKKYIANSCVKLSAMYFILCAFIIKYLSKFEIQLDINI